ncbi:MAG: phospholipase D-like domain-containing protein [Cyclobacteriaceae bacterium]
MEEIIEHLKRSIEDDFLSKAERKSLKELVAKRPLDENQVNFLRSKIYELANQKVSPANYKFMVDWIKDANSALISPAVSTSDAYFSPGEECRNVIISQIKSAVKHLQICVFTISDDVITDAILTSHKRGTDIKIITDNDKSLDEGSDIEQIARQGIVVKMDRTPNHMHHKFMVVDGKTLITGSYNWTRSAARFNHENILLTREGGVVKSFLKEFDQLWKVMEEY